MRGQSASWTLGVQNESDAAASGLFLGTGATDEDLFHLTRGGDVGVGTANPTARLDVDGDVRIRGDVQIDGSLALASETRHLMIPAAAFVAGSSAMKYRIEYGEYLYGTDPGQSVEFYAPVQLPDGAVVTEIRFTYNQTSATGNGASELFWLRLGARSTQDGNIVHEEAVTANGWAENFSSTETVNVPIENDVNQHYLRVNWTTPYLDPRGKALVAVRLSYRTAGVGQ